MTEWSSLVRVILSIFSAVIIIGGVTLFLDLSRDFTEAGYTRPINETNKLHESLDPYTIGEHVRNKEAVVAIIDNSMNPFCENAIQTHQTSGAASNITKTYIQTVFNNNNSYDITSTNIIDLMRSSSMYTLRDEFRLFFNHQSDCYYFSSKTEMYN